MCAFSATFPSPIVSGHDSIFSLVSHEVNEAPHLSPQHKVSLSSGCSPPSIFIYKHFENVERLTDELRSPVSAQFIHDATNNSLREAKNTFSDSSTNDVIKTINLTQEELAD